MDICNISENQREYELRHPETDEPIGWFWTLRPSSSDEVKAADRKWQNRMIQSRRHKFSAEQLDQRNLSLEVAGVAGWRFEGDATFGGETPEHSPEFCEKVFKMKHWIRSQIHSELDNDTAFFGG